MSDAKQFPAGGDRSDAFPPRPSSPDSSANLLQAGLLALKHKEYHRAIEQLEAVTQSLSRRDASRELQTLRLKAEMGLVKAYARTQQPQKAIVLCRTLCRSSNSQVQGWASQTLNDLEHRYQSASEPEPPSSPWADETGFVPLATDAPDPTGFTPLASPAQDKASPQLPPLRAAIPLETQPETDRPPSQIQPLVESFPPAPESVTPKARSAHSPHETANSLDGERGSQRLQKESSLGAVDRSGFWALQAGTIAFLVWWIDALINFGRDRLNDFLLSVRFDFLNLSLWAIYFKPFWGVVIGLTVLFFASPWLLDAVLKSCYGIEDLRRAELESFSPEALRLLKRETGTNQRPFPMLKRLPVAVPLCFAYGYLPRNARIVVSQGLLEQLEPDEIAALLAAEWSHVLQRDAGILSLAAIVFQLPYRVYWSAASWGDRFSNPVLQGLVQNLAIGVSSIAYGIYWLLKLPALLLSRIRLLFSDRRATELTGNPNGLSRALLKLTIGMAETTAQHGSTPPLVESFDLLMPVSHRQALTLGSLLRQMPKSDLLEWDRRQPDRRWLNALSTHPLLGDRLSRLTRYAQQWRLEPQISWQAEKPRSVAKAGRSRLYFAPFLGILAGWGLAGILWAIGFLAKQMRWLEIDWMWADWSVVTGLGLLGFSLGTFFRINPFFPDIKRSALKGEVPLMDWLTDPTALPIDPRPVRLQGQLLGRRGILNRLHQDLFLQLDSSSGEAIDRGMIRLHFTSQWGAVGDVLFQMLRPEIWIAPPVNARSSKAATPVAMPQTVTVIGWFRRGATPWIDVETIQSQRGTLSPKGEVLRIARSGYPVWSTILATIAAFLGAYVIFTGGA